MFLHNLPQISIIQQLQQVQTRGPNKLTQYSNHYNLINSTVNTKLYLIDLGHQSASEMPCNGKPGVLMDFKNQMPCPNQLPKSHDNIV